MKYLLLLILSSGCYSSKPLNLTYDGIYSQKILELMTAEEQVKALNDELGDAYKTIDAQRKAIEKLMSENQQLKNQIKP